MSLESLPGRLVPLADRVPAWPGVGARPAAVLALLSEGPDPDLLFTERAQHLRHHAGQISFPGGRIDRGDASPSAAALRETHEEVGLVPEAVQLLGQLPSSTLSTTMFRVTTVVGMWSGALELAPHEAEVAAVHRWPIALLASQQVRRRAKHPMGGSGPAFVFDDIVIWGFTAHLVDQLLRLGGWEQPWDDRAMIEVPSRFRRSGL